MHEVRSTSIIGHVSPTFMPAADSDPCARAAAGRAGVGPVRFHRGMSDLTSSRSRAKTFTALHVPGRPVVLPNAWDAASACIIERAGAPAIATSSAAVAWSLGRADGNVMSRDEAVGAVARIAGAVELPVTADVETGYGEGDEALATTVRALIDAGAVGVNLEDSGGDPLWPVDVAAHRVQVARAAADEVGLPLYINARTDVYLAQVGEPEGRFDEAVRRAEAFLAAGASGIFVPGVADLAVIAQLTGAIAAPVNILVGPRSPSVAELARAGVARISTGSSLGASVLGVLRRAVTELLATGDVGVLAGGIPYGDLNEMFIGR
jgi:2-methylisocitrate lyase-like PEP mutase family enzyme